MTLTDMITPLEEVVRDVRPSIVYCRHGGDVKIDHTILFKAALVSIRPTELCTDVGLRLRSRQQHGAAHPRVFVPDTFVDISSTLEQKLRAMNCYKPELRDDPHPPVARSPAPPRRFFGEPELPRASTQQKRL